MLSHPLIQADLARQQRDLKELAGNQQDPARIADRIRQRAKAEAETIFKPQPH